MVVGIESSIFFLKVTSVGHFLSICSNRSFERGNLDVASNKGKVLDLVQLETSLLPVDVRGVQ